MAYFDHAKAAYENKCKEEYEKLKENLKKSKTEEDEMLLRHILKLEYELHDSKCKVKSYRDFFQTLQELLPKQSSIHDVLH